MVQHFELVLTHASLASPMTLHCVADPASGPFRAPKAGGGPYWYSVRDTPSVITHLTAAQPSRQVLPKYISPESPITARLLFNGEEILQGEASAWSYNDAEHQCYLRFTPDFAIDCAELVQRRRRVAFVPYWRDTDEDRYVAMMVFEEEFFSPLRLTRLEELSAIS